MALRLQRLGLLIFAKLVKEKIMANNRQNNNVLDVFLIQLLPVDQAEDSSSIEQGLLQAQATNASWVRMTLLFEKLI
eukprot:CAMPEP_0178474376 /NCGR_PEP_ID=MMETSP0696-20121128/2569_1 /TAXON_ID=265572 /ORGANISM="Extubocellulus spinifer, Strain CCMP396" /LENGTH=76 /DNA_ID=CAMNT_0020101625 /DNA_START=76 /DNA_END=306 /DNA_ORIENTATION=-